jgi:ANTAR domain-containing protein
VALNPYSLQGRSFDLGTRAEAVALAAQAVIPLRNAQTQARLRCGMVSRTVIGPAEGVLTERLKMTADQTFGVLARLSQAGHVELRNVARRLVQTGQVPGSRPARTGFEVARWPVVRPPGVGWVGCRRLT